MKHAAKIIGKGVLMLIAGAVVGTLLLTMVYMLPVNMENRDASYETLEQEGWYPRATVTSRSMDTYFHSYFPDVLDGASDRVMLYMAMDDGTGSPLTRAMESYNDYMGENYSRYWHGYVVLLRPLFLFFNYTELRVINGACQLLLVLILATIIGRKKGVCYVLVLATSYVLLSSIAMPLGLQFSWVFYIAHIGTLILLLKTDFIEKNHRYIYFFMALGMFTSYFDLLTYPLATWGLPLVWWIVMTERDEKESFWTDRVVFSGVSWIAGYAGMWCMKWVLATLILGRNIFESAIGRTSYWSGLQQTEESALSGRLQAIYINWKHYEYKVYGVILAAWLIWWVCRIVFRGGGKGIQSVRHFC